MGSFEILANDSISVETGFVRRAQTSYLSEVDCISLQNVERSFHTVEIPVFFNNK